MKRKTTKQFKQEVFHLVGRKYIVKESYKNASTPILFLHNTKHPHYCRLRPDAFLHNGQRCYKCRRRKQHLKKTEHFKNKVNKLTHGAFSVIGYVINCHTPVLIRHNTKHPHTFKKAPTNFLQYPKCPRQLKKRWTTKLFKQYVYKHEGNKYTVLEPLKTVNTKIKMRHNTKYPHIFYITPTKFMKGERCGKCYGKRRWTTNEFKKKVYQLVNNKFTVLGQYKSSKTPILMRHNTKHPHVFYILPKSFLQDPTCKVCTRYRRSTTYFKRRLYKEVGNKYTVLGKYKRADQAIKLRHNTVHPHIIYMTPSSLLAGHRCYKCFGAKQKTTKQFKQEVFKLVGDKYTVISQYRNAHTKVLMRHNTKHPHTFLMTPDDFLKGSRCPICEHVQKKTTLVFKKEVYKLVGNSYSVLSSYKNAQTKVLMRHNTKHPHTFKMAPHKFLEGRRCPICAKHNQESRGELAINNWLQNHNFKINKDYFYGYHLHTYKYNHKHLHADFYIPKLHTIIEYDGRQHYEPVMHFGGIPSLITQRRNDKAKNNYCMRRKLIMIRIKGCKSTLKHIHCLIHKALPHFLQLAQLICTLRNV